jgi:hypothetical protein
LNILNIGVVGIIDYQDGIDVAEICCDLVLVRKVFEVGEMGEMGEVGVLRVLEEELRYKS